MIERTPAIYVINSNNNNIFVQVKRGETLGKLIKLAVGEEDRGQGRATQDYSSSVSLL